MRKVLGLSLSVALGLVSMSLLTAAVAVGQSEEPTDPMRPRAATIDFEGHPPWLDGTRRADDPGVLHFEATTRNSPGSRATPASPER